MPLTLLLILPCHLIVLKVNDVIRKLGVTHQSVITLLDLRICRDAQEICMHLVIPLLWCRVTLQTQTGPIPLTNPSKNQVEPTITQVTPRTPFLVQTTLQAHLMRNQEKGLQINTT